MQSLELFNDEHFTATKELVLRDYQQQAINKAKVLFSKGEKRAMMCSPTGSGKTVIFTAIVKAALEKGSKVLIIVDAISLIEQTSKVLDDYGLDHHIIQADHWRRKEWLNLHLASAQTLARRLWGEYSLVVVDEAHVSYLSTRQFLDHHNSYAIGLSATPFHATGKADWHNLIVVERMGNLIDKGYLSPYIVYAPKPPDLSKVETQNGDFNQKQLGDAVDKTKIVGDVVKTWLRYGEDELTMCFGVNIAHSKHLCSEFQRYNIKAEHIDSWDDETKVTEVIERFKRQEIKVLCSVAKLIKGFDVPEVGCLVDAAPTKSLMRHIQKWGRCLRIAEGKQKSIILDHGGNLERNGYPEDIYIDDLLEEPEHRSKNIKREKPLPKPCTSCGFDSDGVVPCPRCDFMPEKPNLVAHEEGELGKIEKITSTDKAKWYSMLLGYSRSKNFNDGWAAHAFFDKFKSWPHKKNGVIPMIPDEEVRNYITHLQIKKGNANPVQTTCKYCGGNKLIKGAGKGPHAASLVCSGCGKFQQWIAK